MKSREYPIVFFRYYTSDYTTEYLKQFEGGSIVTAFSEDLKYSQAQSYVQNIKVSMHSGFSVTQNMDFISTGFELWQNAMIQGYSDSGQQSPPFDYLRLNLVGSEESITSGKVSVENSNYVTRGMYLMEISNTGELFQIYPSKGTIKTYEADPYIGSLPSVCQFGKSIEHYEYSTSMLAVFYSLFAIGLLCGLLSIIFVALHYNHRVITSFGKIHNFLYSFYLMLLSLSSLPLAAYPNSDIVCWNRIWMLAFAVKGILALLLAKATNLWKHYRSKQSVKVLKSKITIVRILSYWLPLNIVEAVLIIIFAIINNMQYILYIYIFYNSKEEVYSLKFSDYFTDIYIRQCTMNTVFMYICYYILLL